MLPAPFLEGFPTDESRASFPLDLFRVTASLAGRGAEVCWGFSLFPRLELTTLGGFYLFFALPIF